MASVNLAGNKLRAPGLKALSQALKGSKISVLNISNCELYANAEYTADEFSGITQFCEDIHDMGALVTLDISGNEIGAEGAKHLAPALQEW